MPQVPNLPGYVSNSTKPGFRSQRLGFNSSGFSTIRETYSKKSSQASTAVVKSDVTLAQSSVPQFAADNRMEMMSTLNAIAAGQSELSTHQNLHFFAYWRESVAEGLEQFRIRKVNIFYVVEEGSIFINEKKVKNAGLPQGSFLKKHRIPKPEGGVYTLDDLKVGADINVYGRIFHITGTEPLTRQWLTERGFQVSPDEVVPQDDFAKTHADLAKKTHNATKTPMKKYMEAMRGKAVGCTKKLGDFLKADRQVLRFYAVWDDTTSSFGDLNKYVVHFFLADATVEILDVIGRNSGKAPFPYMLRRRRLPLDHATDLGFRGDEEVKDAYFTAAHFKVGATLNVYGKKLMLYKADDTTKDWYIREFGMTEADFTPIPIDDGKGAALPKPEPPPYMGGLATIGGELDSLQSCLSLHPKAVRAPVTEKQLQNNILRFIAELDTTKPEDVDRRFVIAYYCADDTCSIYETAQKNSGIIPGKFLRRGSCPYEASAFGIGSKVTLNMYTFRVLDMDRFTEDFVMKKPREFPWADIKRTLTTMHTMIRQRETERSFFQAIDYDNSGNITIDEIRQYVKAVMNQVMTEPELMTLMRFFDSNKDGKISFDEIRAWLMSNPDEWTPIEPGMRMSNVTFTTATGEEKTALAVQSALQRFAAVFEDRRNQKWQQILRQDEKQTGMISKQLFEDALRSSKKLGDHVLPGEDIVHVKNYFFRGGKEEIKYSDFIHEINAIGTIGGPSA
jgi:Ca2+-binding EF-hand superfamily protein